MAFSDFLAAQNAAKVCERIAPVECGDAAPATETRDRPDDQVDLSMASDVERPDAPRLGDVTPVEQVHTVYTRQVEVVYMQPGRSVFDVVV